MVEIMHGLAMQVVVMGYWTGFDDEDGERRVGRGETARHYAPGGASCGCTMSTSCVFVIVGRTARDDNVKLVLGHGERMRRSREKSLVATSSRKLGTYTIERRWS